jgi:drug/metabolite transporter (DMT)-like permease
MNQLATPALCHRPARWSLLLAFVLVYVSWGTTYLAIQKGVEAFPPCLFGGCRVALAGLVLLSYLRLRGLPLRVSGTDFFWTGVVGVLMFVGGNGLLTFAEKSVASGVASVLAATSPFWMALWELLAPRGERLCLRGWIGLVAGLAGVVILLAPKLETPAAFWQDIGPLLILGSALSWSLGSFVMRHRRLKVAHLASAAYQMVIGGGTMAVIGLLLGEGGQLAADQFTPQAVYAFFHLLVVGSLIGFVAYNWLLGHVSAAMAGTYAYVNPVVAILTGWLLNDEQITIWIVGGMAIILAGVALVRGGSVRREGSSVFTRPSIPDRKSGAESNARFRSETPEFSSRVAPQSCQSH